MAASDPFRTESVAINSRRTRCGGDVADPKRWGLALSGGGIRSATFCLGVIKSLARNGLLARFDYLSTVSGGGYAGSALGRLFQAVGDPLKVQSEIADDGRLFWWWLRKNGRYLFPAGVKDALFAGSTLLRNLTAVYFDLFLVGALVGCLIVLPHLAGMVMGREFSQWIAWSSSAWWIFAAAMPCLFLTCTWAYWFSSATGRWRIYPACIGFGGIGLLVSVLLGWPTLAQQLAFDSPATLVCSQVVTDTNPALYAAWAIGCLSSTSRFVLLQLSLSLPLAVIVALLAGAKAGPDKPADPALPRHRLTQWLMYVLDATIVIVAAAIIDMLSWWIAGTLVQGWTIFAASGGGMLVLIAAGRAILQWLKDLKPGPASINVVRVANVAGLIVGFLFLLLCATFVQVVVFYGGGFMTGAPPVNEPEIWASQSAARLVLLALPCLLYILFTGANLSSLNASSLHNFYRARLTRSYLSVGNSERGFNPTALEPDTVGATNALLRVSDIVAHDDIALADYQPHAHGGPLHLVNVCFNQTVNDRTGEFNRDRKGRNMTVSSLGCDLGSLAQHTVVDYRDGAGPTLGQWIAISGAAASPGMGSHTSKGLASLLTLCGVRLGYWLDVARTDGTPLKASTLLRRLLPKYAHLLDEMLATFPGSDDRRWFLSDGGHFENTGAYALIKREVDVIVIADCGADPNYAFDDLNNLVRLARIDFNAEIIFQQPDDDLAWAASVDLAPFGTLAEIAAADNSSFLVKARIKYASGKQGHLLIVKPTMIGSLPLDLMSYKSGNPAFPQQTTADQFFDEAQWESYFRLGEELGSTVSAKLLGDLPKISGCFRDQLGTGIALSDPDRVAAAARTQPKFAGEVVKSSLGIGAVAGLMFSFYQVWDQQRGSTATEQRQYAEAVTKAVERSVDSAGNLRLSDSGILMLEGIIKPGEPLRTDLDFTLARNLVGRLSALCPQGPAIEASAQCRQLAALAQPFAPQGGTVMTAYWPGWPKEEKPNLAQADSGLGAILSSLTGLHRYSATMRPAPPPPIPPLAGAPVDLRDGAVKLPEPEAGAPPSAPPGSSRGTVPVDARVGAAPTVTAKTLPAQLPASADPVLAAKTVCQRPAEAMVRLYTQVYRPEEYGAFVRAKTTAPESELAGTITFAAIENVAATATKLGTRPPYQWTAPTLIYHNESEQACAEALANVYEAFYGPKPNVRSLPERLKKQPGAIELWVPVGGAPKLLPNQG